MVDFFESAHTSLCGLPSTLSGMIWFAACLAIVPLLSIESIMIIMFINCHIGGIGQKEHNHLCDIRDQTKNHVKKGIRTLKSHDR